MCFSISDVSVAEGNVGGTQKLTFTVTSTGTGTASVNYATSDNSATTANGDYTAITLTQLTFVGATSQTIDIAVTGDTLCELDETLFVDLSSPTNGAKITKSQGIGTITNDDG